MIKWRILRLAAFALAVGVVTTANGAPIAIVNPGFESPTAPPGGYDGWPTNWDVHDWYYEAFGEPSTFVANAFGGITAHGGSQFLEQDCTSYIQQTLAEHYQQGATYTLRFWALPQWGEIFPGETWTAGYQADLGWLNGGSFVSVAAVSGALPGESVWHEYSLAYTASAADAAKDIVIRLSNINVSMALMHYLDDVSLEGPEPPSPIIPEPCTLIVWSLLGASGIGIGWWRRRRAA
jgi:hypothetical protein